MRIGPSLVLFPACVLLGCGAGPGPCTDDPVFSVGPTAAVVSSSAVPPGNQTQFLAEISFAPSRPGCAVPAIALRPYPPWTNPDPVHISISSSNDPTNGTAVCKGPTAGAVTLTATTTYNSVPPQQLTGFVQLTCN